MKHDWSKIKDLTYNKINQNILKSYIINSIFIINFFFFFKF